jgi:hypothetical protein
MHAPQFPSCFFSKESAKKTGDGLEKAGDGVKGFGKDIKQGAKKIWKKIFK